MKKHDNYFKIRFSLYTIFILSLFPILILGIYNHPCADDYMYGADCRNVIDAGGTFLDVIKTAFHVVVGYWQGWQGTYSSIFLMNLQPGLYDESLYALTTPIMLTMLCGGTMLFLYVFLHKYCGLETQTVWFVGIFLLLVTIQTMAVPVQGLYWYNGAVHYMFMYGCMLYLFACILLFMKSQKKIGKCIYFLLVTFLSFICAGGNYVTALTGLLLYLLIFFLFLVRKKWKIWPVIFPFFLYVGGFVINVIAPGNSVRQARFEQPSIIGSIKMSFEFAFQCIDEYLNLPIFIMLLICVPILIWKLDEAKFKYYHPLLTLVGSYCFFSAMFEPTSFAEGKMPAGRICNILQAFLYLILLLNIVNIVGWSKKRIKNTVVISQEFKIQLEEYGRRFAKTFMLLGVFGLLVMGMSFYGTKSVSVKAAKSLFSGEAAKYDKEYKARIELFQNSKGKDVVVKSFKVKPELLYFSDMSSKADHWNNAGVSRYYQLKSVVRE